MNFVWICWAYIWSKNCQVVWAKTWQNALIGGQNIPRIPYLIIKKLSTRLVCKPLSTDDKHSKKYFVPVRDYRLANVIWRHHFTVRVLFENSMLISLSLELLLCYWHMYAICQYYTRMYSVVSRHFLLAVNSVSYTDSSTVLCGCWFDFPCITLPTPLH